ncbi:DUF397 domain-containing protein [Streptomyces iranensis]|uniref:DUF397 domain-containing protein n=1 Tax=Streptomyces iranensis TaxID=576784 RepID=UPI0039B72D46
MDQVLLQRRQRRPCVEFSRTFAQTYGAIPVRDSKVPHGPTLTVSTEAWSSFVSDLMRAELPAA